VNLFVAVIVDSINSIKHHETKQNDESNVATQLQALQLEIAELKALIKANTTRQD
jgi:hypothetical protein